LSLPLPKTFFGCVELWANAQDICVINENTHRLIESFMTNFSSFRIMKEYQHKEPDETKCIICKKPLSESFATYRYEINTSHGVKVFEKRMHFGCWFLNEEKIKALIEDIKPY